MEFKSLMHIAFYTNQLDQMLDFYVNKLGMTKKSELNYSVYLNRDDRPALQKIAREEPDRIFNSYLEAALGQFIELFRPMRLRRSTRSGMNIRAIRILPFWWMIFSRRAISFWR